MTKDNNFRKENKCPYCGYFCDAAQMLEDPSAIPTPGDLTFCIMCTEASQFDKDLNMIKFDINSIEDLIERNRIKGIQVKMGLFWDEHPELQKLRDDVLNGKS